MLVFPLWLTVHWLCLDPRYYFMRLIFCGDSVLYFFCIRSKGELNDILFMIFCTLVRCRYFYNADTYFIQKCKYSSRLSLELLTHTQINEKKRQNNLTLVYPPQKKIALRFLYLPNQLLCRKNFQITSHLPQFQDFLMQGSITSSTRLMSGVGVLQDIFREIRCFSSPAMRSFARWRSCVYFALFFLILFAFSPFFFLVFLV